MGRNQFARSWILYTSGGWGHSNRMGCAGGKYVAYLQDKKEGEGSLCWKVRAQKSLNDLSFFSLGNRSLSAMKRTPLQKVKLHPLNGTLCFCQIKVEEIHATCEGLDFESIGEGSRKIVSQIHAQLIDNAPNARAVVTPGNVNVFQTLEGQMVHGLSRLEIASLAAL